MAAEINARRADALALTGLHATFGRHPPDAELAAALSRLEATGRARRSLKETAGRPAEVWEAIDWRPSLRPT